MQECQRGSWMHETHTYREVPPVLSGRTKENLDKPDIALVHRKAAALLFRSSSRSHPSLPAPLHLPPAPLVPCQNPISSINDMWFEVKACGRTRKAQDQPSQLFVFDTCITREKYFSRGRVSLATWTAKKEKNVARGGNQFLSWPYSSPWSLNTWIDET